MKNLRLYRAGLSAAVVILIAACSSQPGAELAPPESESATAQEEVADGDPTDPELAAPQDVVTQAPETSAGATGEEPEEGLGEAPEIEPEETAPAGNLEAADSCDWDAARLAGAGVNAPPGQAGELAQVIIGAWQHTHIDDGNGFEVVENDLRFVFPEATEMLYCQHVPGITDYAENRGEISWDGNQLNLPGGTPGYIVTHWDAQTMIWQNLIVDSTYLLQRR